MSRASKDHAYLCVPAGEEPLIAQLLVKFTAAELGRLRRAADRAGLSAQEFLRRIVRDHLNRMRVSVPD